MTARTPAPRSFSHRLTSLLALLLWLAPLVLLAALPAPARSQDHALLLGSEDLARMAQAARIAAHGDGDGNGRRFFSSGDRVYATGLQGDARPGQLYRIYRKPRPIASPDGAVLSHEAQFLGRAIYRTGTPALAAFDIVFARREIQAGDLLLPE